MELVIERLEALRADVRFCLDFHRDGIHSYLQKEILFEGRLIRAVVIWCIRGLAYNLLQDKLFCQGSLELNKQTTSFQNRFGVKFAHCRKQPYVEHEQLIYREFLICREGHARFVYAIYFVHKPAINKPLNRRLKIAAAIAPLAVVNVFIWVV